MNAILKLLIFILSLLIVGITLTLSLPDYKVDSGTPTESGNYVVNADTLKTPLSMDDLLLPMPMVPDTRFALRLGLFGQLSLAKAFAEQTPLPAPPLIVKASDVNRDWYLVLIGPFASQNEADQKKQWLQNKQISATLITWVEPESN